MEMKASIKVCDPVPAPAFLVEELRTLRAQVEQLLRENQRLRRELDRAKADLDAARRAGKRQAAPFAKGQPTAQPKKPGRKPGKDYGPKAHRQPPPSSRWRSPRKPIHRQFNIHV